MRLPALEKCMATILALRSGQSEHLLADMIFKLRNHVEFEEKMDINLAFNWFW